MPENTFGKSVEIPESHPTTLFRIYQHFQQKLDLFRDFSVTMYHTNLHTSIELYHLFASSVLKNLSVI